MIEYIKKSAYFLLLLSFALNSCNKEPIPVKQMGHILADMAAAEGYARGLNRANDSTYKNTDVNMDTLRYFYQSILAHYNVDEPTFKKAQKWYLAHPNMYDSVLLYSIQLQNDLQKKAHTPPKIVPPNPKLNKADSSEQLLNNRRKNNHDTQNIRSNETKH